jgi:hypothetical protein
MKMILDPKNASRLRGIMFMFCAMCSIGAAVASKEPKQKIMWSLTAMTNGFAGVFHFKKSLN